MEEQRLISKTEYDKLGYVSINGVRHPPAWDALPTPPAPLTREAMVELIRVAFLKKDWAVAAQFVGRYVKKDYDTPMFSGVMEATDVILAALAGHVADQSEEVDRLQALYAAEMREVDQLRPSIPTREEALTISLHAAKNIGVTWLAPSLAEAIVDALLARLNETTEPPQTREESEPTRQDSTAKSSQQSVSGDDAGAAPDSDTPTATMLARIDDLRQQLADMEFNCRAYRREADHAVAERDAARKELAEFRSIAGEELLDEARNICNGLSEDEVAAIFLGVEHKPGTTYTISHPEMFAGLRRVAAYCRRQPSDGLTEKELQDKCLAALREQGINANYLRLTEPTENWGAAIMWRTLLPYCRQPSDGLSEKEILDKCLTALRERGIDTNLFNLSEPTSDWGAAIMWQTMLPYCCKPSDGLTPLDFEATKAWWEEKRGTLWPHDERILRAICDHFGTPPQPDRLTEGHDEPCYYCGEKCSSVSGHPGDWPIGLCHPDNPGVVRFHHAKCVTARLRDHDGTPPLPILPDDQHFREVAAALAARHSNSTADVIRRGQDARTEALIAEFHKYAGQQVGVPRSVTMDSIDKENVVDDIARSRGWAPLMDGEDMTVHYAGHAYIIKRQDDRDEEKQQGPQPDRLGRVTDDQTSFAWLIEYNYPQEPPKWFGGFIDADLRVAPLLVTNANNACQFRSVREAEAIRELLRGSSLYQRSTVTKHGFCNKVQQQPGTGRKEEK